tara:strand:- start:1731 stop:2000 length:270 start_codon:yes stop_codon:yes gene_type:complete
MSNEDKIYDHYKNKIIVVYQNPTTYKVEAKVFTSFTKAHDFQENGSSRGPVKAMLNLKERDRDYILNLVERLYFDQNIDLTVGIVKEYF